MKTALVLFTLLMLGTMGCASVPTNQNTSLKDQVAATERAFAATMAKRDLAAFANFIDEEAIFITGPEPLRGKKAVVDWWARFFKDPQAPFSWEPDQVEVLESGTLALSSGPARDSAGAQTNRFESIWRKNAAGEWKIIFDKGSPLPCDCKQ